MNDAVPLAPTRHKLDVYDFFRLVETGIVPADQRVELIDGALIDMAPIGEDHAGTVNQLNELLGAACYLRAIVSVQNPVRFDRYTELQPDIAVCRRRADFYRSEHAKPSDVLLLIEVADSPLRYDQTVKRDIYARAGIVEYWIVDRQNKGVIVHREPSATGFRDVQTIVTGVQLRLAAAPDIVVDLADLVTGDSTLTR